MLTLHRPRQLCGRDLTAGRAGLALASRNNCCSHLAAPGAQWNVNTCHIARYSVATGGIAGAGSPFLGAMRSTGGGRSDPPSGAVARRAQPACTRFAHPPIAIAGGYAPRVPRDKPNPYSLIVVQHYSHELAEGWASIPVGRPAVPRGNPRGGPCQNPRCAQAPLQPQPLLAWQPLHLLEFNRRAPPRRARSMGSGPSGSGPPGLHMASGHR